MRKSDRAKRKERGVGDLDSRMSRIAEKEDRLFAAWASRHKLLVRDGTVDADEYARSPVKLLFVLKEVNDPGGGGWDLRQFLRDGGRGSTWNTVTRWVEGIQRLPCIVPWSELSTVDNDRRKRVLRKIAVVNLKKEPGGGTADHDGLRAAAQRDRKFISAQLSLYAPDYVICCGTLVADLLIGSEAIGVYPLNNDEWTSTRRGVWYRNVDGTPHIAYHHPQARLPGNLLHYGLIDAVEELAELS